MKSPLQDPWHGLYNLLFSSCVHQCSWLQSLDCPVRRSLFTDHHIAEILQSAIVNKKQSYLSPPWLSYSLNSTEYYSNHQTNLSRSLTWLEWKLFHTILKFCWFGNIGVSVSSIHMLSTSQNPRTTCDKHGDSTSSRKCELIYANRHKRITLQRLYDVCQNLKLASFSQGSYWVTHACCKKQLTTNEYCQVLRKTKFIHLNKNEGSQWATILCYSCQQVLSKTTI